ncbi:MAG TPA: hypothetical protein VNO22_10955 [Planctomycetota bacterium]|nr:hypothetical protein [Planctomycetota bacterium]
MKTFILTVMLPAASALAVPPPDDPPAPPDAWLNDAVVRDMERSGLWYGTPGVRPGEDMLGPLLRLVREPARLLDFSPRRASAEVTRSTGVSYKEGWKEMFPCRKEVP